MAVLCASDLLARAEPKESVRGTFNAAAIQGLQASGVAERTARATEDMARNTKKLVDKANTGGLTFV